MLILNCMYVSVTLIFLNSLKISSTQSRMCVLVFISSWTSLSKIAICPFVLILTEGKLESPSAVLQSLGHSEKKLSSSIQQRSHPMTFQSLTTCTVVRGTVFPASLVELAPSLPCQFCLQEQGTSISKGQFTPQKGQLQTIAEQFGPQGENDKKQGSSRCKGHGAVDVGHMRIIVQRLLQYSITSLPVSSTIGQLSLG